MSCYINGELHEIVKVDFEEYTIGVMSPNGETIIDFPCEFVTINERGGAR